MWTRGDRRSCRAQEHALRPAQDVGSTGSAGHPSSSRPPDLPARSSVQTDRSTASRPRSLLQVFLREGIGWNIRPGSARSSLEDATGYVSGARVTGRDISREPGLSYIWADGIDMVRSRVAAHGSEVVEGSNFSSWVAHAGSRCVLRGRHFRMGCDRLAIQRSLPRVESYSPASHSRRLHSPRRESPGSFRLAVATESATQDQ
jgi:hypothetical protein